MICPTCGTELRDGVLMCPICGTKQEVPAPSRQKTYKITRRSLPRLGLSVSLSSLHSSSSDCAKYSYLTNLYAKKNGVIVNENSVVFHVSGKTVHSDGSLNPH